LPLSERARIEVYLPDLPSPDYRELLAALQQEFAYTFGGCTLAGGLSGNYLSQMGLPVQDRVNLLYTDAPFNFDGGFSGLSRYTDALRVMAFEALEEETILVVALRVYHSE
jgi:hypothetical protein